MPDFTTFPGPHVRGDGGSRRSWKPFNPNNHAILQKCGYICGYTIILFAKKSKLKKGAVALLLPSYLICCHSLPASDTSESPR